MPAFLASGSLRSPENRTTCFFAKNAASNMRLYFESAILTFLSTLRGKKVVCTFGKTPVVDGVTVDYTKWKLFEGPYLNAEKGSRKLTITHGQLERVLDFNTLTISDRVLAH